MGRFGKERLYTGRIGRSGRLGKEGISSAGMDRLGKGWIGSAGMEGLGKERSI